MLNQAHAQLAIQTFTSHLPTRNPNPKYVSHLKNLFTDLASGKAVASNAVLQATANDLGLDDTAADWQKFLTDCEDARSDTGAYKSPEVEKYSLRYPDEVKWIVTHKDTNAFAQSLYNYISKYSALTANQLAAVQKNVTIKTAAPSTPPSMFEQAQPHLHTESLMAAFDKAKANKVQYPKMRFEGFVISPAPETGRNAGAIYVKADDGVYLGKIAQGKFYPTRDCNETAVNKVHAILKDPLKEAVAYGKRVGMCSICGRRLDNQESIDRGIGPICFERFFGMPSEITSAKETAQERKGQISRMKAEAAERVKHITNEPTVSHPGVNIEEPKVLHTDVIVSPVKPKKGVVLFSSKNKTGVAATVRIPSKNKDDAPQYADVRSSNIYQLEADSRRVQDHFTKAIKAALKKAGLESDRPTFKFVNSILDKQYPSPYDWDKEVKRKGLEKANKDLTHIIDLLITRWMNKHDKASPHRSP